MKDPEQDLQIVQHAISEAVENNNYSFITDMKFRMAIKRLCIAGHKREEAEAKLFGFNYNKVKGDDFCSVDNQEKVNERLHQIYGNPLTFPMGVWLQECLHNGMFNGMDNKDYS